MTLKKDRPVRKNITIRRELNEKLEIMSVLSGKTQGLLIEEAFETWRLRMHFVFAKAEQPLAESCEVYINNNIGKLEPNYFALYLTCFRYWLTLTSFKWQGFDDNGISRDVESLNEYIANHIPVHLQEKYPKLQTIASMAEEGTFLTTDLTDNIGNIKLYIDTLRSYQDNEDVYKEDYLLRNLIVTFRDFALPVSPEYRRGQYHQFCMELRKLNE